MDEALNSAARALDAGDVLFALKHVALRGDAPALALRGVALARLGELGRARELLREAARAFGTQKELSHARCLLADAEIALQLRELRDVDANLRKARSALARHGDHDNARYASALQVQTLLWQKRFNEAEQALAELQAQSLKPVLAVRVELLRAELGLRSLRASMARPALNRAASRARALGIPGLLAEVATLEANLRAPAARLLRRGDEELLSLDQVEKLLQQRDWLVIDALQRAARMGHERLGLEARPVLFTLLRTLAEAFPNDAARGQLMARAFAVSRSNDSHRARLRVEIGRLRRLLGELTHSRISATELGFRLELTDASEAVVLAAPHEDEHHELLALLGDGEAWSSSALALALSRSQRSVQRALLDLLEAGKVRAAGRGRAQRWLPAPAAPFTTPMLLASDLLLG